MIEKLKDLFKKYTGADSVNITELPSSGSNRRYFRLDGGVASLIGVIGTCKEENKAFINLAKHFFANRIRVPKILAVSDDGMSYLQEDLGDTMLYESVKNGRESGEYSSYEKELLFKAVSKLPAMQFKGAEGLDFSVCYPEPEFNDRMVMFDLNYFKYCFLKAK